MSKSFVNCAHTVSKLERSQHAQQVTWRLEGFQDPEALAILKSTAKTRLEVGTSFILQFQLGKHSTVPDVSKEMSLLVKLLDHGPDSSNIFDFEVYRLNDQFQAVEQLASVTQVRMFKADLEQSESFQAKCFLIHELFRIRRRVNGLFCVGEDELPESLHLGIVVTPVHLNATLSTAIISPPAAVGVHPDCVTRDLKRFYLENGADKFADLRLESKDGLVVNAHKFIVGARCRKLRNMIENYMKNSGWDGQIKIRDVNGKPLMILLYWMYTGELMEDVGKFLEELIFVAIKWELAELLNLLDGQLIKICTAENMLELFQVAKRNNLETAKQQISAFIKENL